MFRGSTPTHTFELPIDTETISKVIIVYAQSDIEVFRKTEKDCTIEGNTITTQLTQEETLMLDHKKRLQIQLKVLCLDGATLLSDVLSKDVRKCLIDEVI